MDIDQLLKIVKSVPKEKLRTDAGLKDLLREIGQKSGKAFTDQQLNDYVARFRKMARTEDAESMIDKLTQRGIKPSVLNRIKKGFRK
ncbi:hypothetical protein [Brevibacillus massiliensis]|uniref:hypothetical protein n=1 Tax=Brevibacillus massiliensis TaxID=1118054 RepID=UPI000316E35B|nr:hypothetical protein [Brevibacillus massiliensis]